LNDPDEEETYLVARTVVLLVSRQGVDSALYYDVDRRVDSASEAC
jgi:hypothetical protein